MPQADRLAAEHDGYRRFADPVTHRRELRLDHASGTLVVTDDLLCAGEHQVEIFWHFAPECSVTRTGDRVTATRSGCGVNLQIPPSSTGRVICGSDQPPLGWSSRRFDERVPSPTLVCSATIRGNARFITRMSLLTSVQQAGVEGAGDRDSINEQRSVETEPL
jgi:hypothetical protein